MEKTNKPKPAVKTAKISRSAEIIYTIIGCLPMITISFVCVYLMYGDYARNNYSFFEKSYHLSNVDVTSYEANVTCSDLDHAKEIAQFRTCAPKFCFRYFTDFLLSEGEGKQLLNIAKRGFSVNEPSGGVSLLNAKSLLKEKDDFSVYTNVKNKILTMMKSKFGLSDLYFTKSEFFSKLTNKDPKTLEGEYWHPKVEKNTQESTHYTAVVFLDKYMTEFNGGRFIFRNSDNRTVLSIQPRPARVLVFTSGSENEYYDERLLYGNRIALSFSLTCDKNYALIE